MTTSINIKIFIKSQSKQLSRPMLKGQPFIILILIAIINIVRSYQFYCGTPKQKVTSYALNNRQKYLTTIHNFGLIIDTKDQTAYNYMLEYGTWDAHFLYLMSKLVKENQKILNIGTQNGLEAIVLGKLVGPKGKIFVIEPSSLNYRLAVKNIYLNDLQQITEFYLMAAGMEENEMYIEINEKDPERQFLTHRTIDSVDTEYQRVKVQTVDLILPPATRLDFIYLKSGNYHFEALYGMRQIISQSPSAIILIKQNYFYLSNRNYTNAPKLMFQFLQNRGFTWLKYDITESCQIGTLDYIDWGRLIVQQKYHLLLVGPEVSQEKKDVLGIK